MPSTSLALTVHDPDGRVAAGVERAARPLRGLFSSVAVNATTATRPEVVDAVATCLAAEVITHDQDEGVIGAARRDAVALALGHGCDQVVYADADHVLRWIEARPDEVAASLGAPAADLVVIGRSPRAFRASPQRLRDTEALVNRIYSLMRPGRSWDLMFAIRRLSRRAADLIVRSCDEATVANDVVWPLLVEAHGLTVGYYAADGLSYRTIHDFDGPPDAGDGDPREWIRRVDIARVHAVAMARFA